MCGSLTKHSACHDNSEMIKFKLFLSDCNILNLETWPEYMKTGTKDLHFAGDNIQNLCPLFRLDDTTDFIYVSRFFEYGKKIMPPKKIKNAKHISV